LVFPSVLLHTLLIAAHVFGKEKKPCRCIVFVNKLAKDGLTLRLYPNNYPSSTVSGWLAQGGGGIGSFEFGWFEGMHGRLRKVQQGSGDDSHDPYHLPVECA
jgi:hypothetical protein